MTNDEYCCINVTHTLKNETGTKVMTNTDWYWRLLTYWFYWLNNNGWQLLKSMIQNRHNKNKWRFIWLLLTFKILSLFHKGYKPFRYQGDANKIKEKGWFIRKGLGGISGEPLVRFNFGSKFSSFHAYNRKGKPRVSNTWYVTFKSRLFQKLVS